MKAKEGRPPGSLQRTVRPRTTDEQIRHRRRWQWRRNVNRLKVCVLNVLTLGLGENLWYGDVLYEDLNPPLAVRCARFVRVNLNHLKVAAAARWGGGDQVANAGNEGQSGGNRGVRLADRYQEDVVEVHRCVSGPNDPSSATRPTGGAS